MSRKKIQPLSDCKDEHKQTICNMINVPYNRAMELASLLMAVTYLPISTTLSYDKIFGRWIFTNLDEDDWPREELGNNCFGINFAFACRTPEEAIASGVHYYVHSRVKK